MGIIKKQSINYSIIFYIGMFIGAINTVLIYPNVFNDQPDHWGLIQIIVAYSMVLSTFSSFGLPKVIIKFFPSLAEKGNLFFISFLFPIIGILFFLLIYSLFKEAIFDLLNMNILLKENFIYVFLLVFCISFYDIITSISRSHLDAVTPVIFNEFFLKSYTLSILLLHGFKFINFKIFLLLYIVGYLLKLLFLFFIQISNNRISITIGLDQLDFNKIMKFGVFVFAGGLSIILVTRLDMLMIGYLMNLENVAFYTLAFYIGNAIAVPGRSVITISVPLLSKAWENQNFKEIKTIYSKSSINQLIVSGFLFLIIWLNLHDVFTLLPEKFTHGKWVVFYIGLAQLINMACGVNGAIIVNSDYYKFDLYTNLFLLFVTICSNLLLIPKYGINGAAMATALSLMLFNLIRVFIIYFKMGIQPFSNKTIISLCLLLFTYVICVNIPSTSNVFVNILLKSIVAILIFLPLLFKLNLAEDLNNILKGFAKKVNY